MWYKFVSDLRQDGGFLQVSSTNKTNSHDITEILLKVALNKPKRKSTIATRLLGRKTKPLQQTDMWNPKAVASVWKI
jgi:hypothetical protein